MNIPECAHEADKEWLRETLSKLNPTMRQKAIDGYTSVFMYELDNEPLEQKKLNRARHNANVRLRLFIDRYYAASLGHTTKPPEVK